jgi:hypothetical protein
VELLAKDVDVFGLTYFGDGATAKKMTLINMLASGVHLPLAILEINDCSSVRKWKEGRTLHCITTGSLSTHGQNGRMSSIFFDRAANVQKAGRVLAAHYLCLESFHAAAHVINFFFVDLFAFSEFKTIYTIVLQT